MPITNTPAGPTQDSGPIIAGGGWNLEKKAVQVHRARYRNVAILTAIPLVTALGYLSITIFFETVHRSHDRFKAIASIMAITSAIIEIAVLLKFRSLASEPATEIPVYKPRNAPPKNLY